METRAPNPLQALDEAEALDPTVEAVEEKLQRVLSDPARDVLRGESWLGHRLHPLLTDAAIGCFTSATVLDLIGGRASGKAAQRLVGLGILSSVPTAMAGATDWLDGDQQVKRTGLVHAAVNTVALMLFVRSWSRRRRGHRVRGALYGLIASSVMGVGGYLGGHLSYRLGSGVQERAGEAEPPVVDLTGVSGDAAATVTAAGPAAVPPTVPPPVPPTAG